jgi:drug/metabolite transporter (DMT)-like permease
LSRPFSRLRAVVYALLGYTVWVMGDGCTKLAGQASLPAAQIIVISSLFCVLTIFSVTAARGKKHSLVPQRWKPELLRAFLYVVLSFINVTAFTRFPLTTVYSALFTNPIIVAVLAALFMREHLSLLQGLAIVSGFGGVFFALHPAYADSIGSDLTGLITIVLFPVLSAVNIVFIRFNGRKEHSESMAFLPQIVRVLAVLPLCAWQFEPMAPATFWAMAGLGVFSAFGMLLVTAALKHAPAAIVSPFAYTQIVSGAILSYLIWHEAPSLRLIAGSAVVIASGLYLAHHARKVQIKLLVV